MVQADIVSTLQNLISGLDESIVIFDQDGIILHASDRLSEIVDCPEPEGKSIFEFVSDDETGIKEWLRQLNRAHFVDLQIKMLRNQTVFPARIRMAAWSIGADDFIVLASVVDGTFIERKKRDTLRKALIIEQLSKSRKIRTGKLNDAIYEILEMSSRAVHVERVNAWLFDKDGSQLECIGNYDAREHSLVPQDSLPRIDMPRYFKLFETEKIILSSDSQTSELTQELRETYLVPLNIHAMMDIPLRIEGNIIGAICFEQVGKSREWTIQDQKFGLIASQMVSLAVETHQRKLIQQQLEGALRQQKRLMSEMNHRTRNNLAIATSLMRMQLDRCKDQYHRQLVQDAVNRMNSITALHELLNNSGVVDRIQFKPYVLQLLEGLRSSLSNPNKPIQLIGSIDSCEISGSLAITLGLIVNEAVTNSFKHAFKEESTGLIHVEFEVEATKAKLSIHDTGSGFGSGAPVLGKGLDIIAGLSHQIGGVLTTGGDAGTCLSVEFQMV